MSRWKLVLANALRIFAFFSIAALTVVLLGTIIYFALRLAGNHPVLTPHGIPATLNALQLLPVEVLVTIGLVTGMLVLGSYERRSLAEYFFPWRQLFAAPLWIGAGSGFVAIAAVVAVMIATGTAHIDGLVANGPAIAGQAALWGVTFLFVGLSEELAFRGYPLFTIAANGRFWSGAIVMSVLFTVLHAGNPGESPLGFVGVFAVGMMFCYALRRFGDLRWPIGFHAAWDWGQTCFFGTRNSGLFPSGSIFRTETFGSPILSGGSAGPEGSIWAIIAIAVVALALWRMPSRAPSSRA